MIKKQISTKASTGMLSGKCTARNITSNCHHQNRLTNCLKKVCLALAAFASGKSLGATERHAPLSCVLMFFPLIVKFINGIFSSIYYHLSL